MLGLDTYGSESESENEGQQPSKPQLSPGLTQGTSKSSIILPPPNSTTTPKASFPPPKAKRAPKKITIGLPALSKDNEEKDDMELDRPAAKRQKTGAGASSLLSMLPAPKQKTPSNGQTERVLGGGKGPGLIFHTRSSFAPAASNTTTEGEPGEDQENEEGGEWVAEPTGRPTSLTTREDVSSLPFVPPSLVKGKANISVEDKPNLPVQPPLRTVSAAPTIESSTGNSTSTVPSSSTPNYSFSIPTFSSAPAIPTFEPPEPSAQDPYPGYYQLPSGGWASYDPQYYERFRKKWQAEYDAYVRKLEKGAIKGFEGYEEGASEVDAMKEMEKAKIEVREREEKKALTKGATGPVAQPNMKVNPSKLSGIARSRHQLSTLLRDAYENREALEEKIAEGRRNRKEAGNKYGF